MKRLVPYVAVVALAAALAGCNRPGTNTAYNNSGASAAPDAATTTTTTTTSTPSSDTTSPASTTTPTSSTDTSAMGGTVPGATSPVGDGVTSGKVKAAIIAEPALKDADITVTTDGGTVVLTGTVKSQDQIAMATSLAQRQDGVSRVENQVVVK